MITQIFILKDPPVIASDQIRSVTQLCPALCDPMNRSTAAIKWNLLKQGEQCSSISPCPQQLKGHLLRDACPRGSKILHLSH